MDALDTIRYDAATNTIFIIDQTQLPNALVKKELHTLADVVAAIRDLEVRGAPLIGITAAYGLAQVAQQVQEEEKTAFLAALTRAQHALSQARPTAVNLDNALRRMMADIDTCEDVSVMRRTLIARARALHEEDAAISLAIGQCGAALLEDGAQVMTICNAGFLATANRYGTALAPVYVAQEQGKRVAVTALETRPVLQGARLTTFELTQREVPTTLITDGMMGWYLATHHVDAVFVGCDRVATNGDFANKIGTYTLSVLAKEYGVPFYVCTPSTTIDFTAPDRHAITIEFRNPEEVRNQWYEKPMVAAQAEILNPAFDCTPAANVSGYITEKGILQPPFREEMFS